MERKEKIEAALLEFAASVWNLSGPVWADEDMCSDTREKLDKALSAIETEMPRWIPCEERTPEISEMVLVCDAEGIIGTDSIEPDPENGDEDWCYNGVTHWQPLPLPPQESEKEVESE